MNDKSTIPLSFLWKKWRNISVRNKKSIFIRTSGTNEEAIVTMTQNLLII